MTLLDAPVYDARRARRIRNSIITVLIALVVGGILTFVFWDWPEQHRLNHFLSTVEKGDLKSAYAQWNNDPDWEQHPDRYKAYSFADFSKDWGVGSDYGQIKSHKIEITKTVGNGVVMGVDINGGKTPLFLRVDHKTKEIGFSPVELYVGPGL
jgi:uncharacterized membrane protein YraQ (UPF0718 family)